VGQLVGNFMGLPFEFQYNNEPMPFEPKTYYDLGSARSAGLRVNTDGRGRIPQRLSQLQGGIFNKLSIYFYIKHSSKEILISWCFLYVVLDLKVPTQMMTRILSL